MTSQRTKLFFRLSVIAPLSLVLGFWFALTRPFDTPVVIPPTIKVLFCLGVVVVICALASRTIDQFKLRKP